MDFTFKTNGGNTGDTEASTVASLAWGTWWVFAPQFLNVPMKIVPTLQLKGPENGHVMTSRFSGMFLWTLPVEESTLQKWYGPDCSMQLPANQRLTINLIVYAGASVVSCGIIKEETRKLAFLPCGNKGYNFQWSQPPSKAVKQNYSV